MTPASNSVISSVKKNTAFFLRGILMDRTTGEKEKCKKDMKRRNTETEKRRKRMKEKSKVDCLLLNLTCVRKDTFSETKKNLVAFSLPETSGPPLNYFNSFLSKD